jgi:hypothetical protein
VPETDTQAVPPPAVAPAPAGSVGTVGRGVRLVLGVALVVGLLLGSLWGDDWAFPFGPLRMYSTSSPPSGNVTYERFEARTADGRWVRTAMSLQNVGLNRAEVEGRTPLIVADPALLGSIATAHGRLKPRSPWTGLRLIKDYVHLSNGVPQGTTEKVLATWTAS